MTTRPRILFWVQHLLGIGHLRRAAALARAMEDHGLAVTLVSGGMPVRGLDLGGAALEQLPPLRAADASFSTLVGADGRVADAALHEERRGRLLAINRTLAPDVIVTELFPFGRRALRHEVLALLDAARGAAPRPLIVCSVRDVLTERRNPARHREAAGWAVQHYDRVLVHGDPALVPFEATFPEFARIAGRVAYTGYITEGACDDASGADATASGDVLVSAGGGAVGARLLETAIAARAHSSLGDKTWRLLAGDNMPDDTFHELRRRSGHGLVVERARADFPALLRRATVSVSQAGYNTACDLLAARARAVLVPFAADGETEQSERAARMAAHGLAVVLDENALDPGRLAEAVDAAARLARPQTGDIRLDGAAATARIVRAMLDP